VVVDLLCLVVLLQGREFVVVIDFGDEPARRVPDTEFGGADGLIQPARDDGRFDGAPEAKGGHVDLTASELNGVMKRRASLPAVGREQYGEVIDGETVVDPVTGREAPLDRIEDGTTALPSDMQP
jgi:hypothetical protein